MPHIWKVVTCTMMAYDPHMYVQSRWMNNLIEYLVRDFGLDCRYFGSRIHEN
jgi:hypothetical protein